MRGVALWLMSASLAFLVTAAAFLLLANLGSGDPTTSGPIPQAEPSGIQTATSVLVLDLPEDQLEGLERSPGQRLVVGVKNGGDEEITSVALALEVASEDTTRPSVRYYGDTVERLAPQESAAVEFEIDLSPPDQDASTRKPLQADFQPREILEVRATTAEGASAFKTAILTP